MELAKKTIEYSSLAKPAYYFYRSKPVADLFKMIDSLGFVFYQEMAKVKKELILKPENKILLINLGGAGDLILSEPLLAALSDYSQQKVDLLWFPGQEKALLNHPALGKIYNLELPWLGGRKKLFNSLADLWRLSRVLKKEKYFLALDLKGDPLIILLLFFSQIPKRFGFSNGGLGFLLTHSFSQPENLKRYKINLSLGEAYLENFTNYYRAPQLNLPENLIFPESLKNSSTQKIIVIHLGASTQSRRWPQDNWIELIKLLLSEYGITLIGDLEDSKKLFLAAPELRDSVSDLSGKTWLETAQIIKRADLFIGANSGPAHLASALNCPVISIFSAANNPEVWAPNKAKVLIYKPDCYNCELSYCSNLTCLKALTPEMVYRGVSNILKD